MIKKSDKDGDISRISDILSEHGVDTNLQTEIISFLGSIKDINPEFVANEHMSLYLTVKLLISEILTKANIQLLDAKFLKSFSDLVQTASSMLGKTIIEQPKKQAESSEVIQMSEDEIINQIRIQQASNTQKQIQ